VAIINNVEEQKAATPDRRHLLADDAKGGKKPAAAAEGKQPKPKGKAEPKQLDPKEAKKKAEQQKVLAAAVAAALASNRKVQPGGGNGASKNVGGAGGKVGPVQEQEEVRVPKLSEECWQLAWLAEPPDIHEEFNTDLATMQLVTVGLEKLEGMTGVGLVERNEQGGTTGISLTGWTALIGMAALMLVVFAGVVYGLKQWFLGPEKEGYTLVMKTAPK
jgi:hypothetical protein